MSDSNDVAGDVIEVAAAPTFGGHARFVAGRLPKVMWLVVAQGALCVVWYLLNPLIPPPPDGETGSWRATTGTLVWGLLFAVAAPSLVAWSLWSAWRRSPELHAPRTYRFDERGIEIVAEAFRSSLSWSVITAAEVAGGQLLLKTGQPLWVCVPLSAVPDGKVAALRELVSRHVRDSRW
jgi:hypothetical protein